MAVDCAAINAVREFGAPLGILGAAAVWLLNRFLAWVTWLVGRYLKRYELLRALEGEIKSNSNSEALYFFEDSAGAEAAAKKLVDRLRGQVGPYKPLAPYLAVSAGNPVYESAIGSLSLLPAEVSSAVVSYYSASVALTEQLRDFRSDAFLKLNHVGQETVIRDLYSTIGAECGSAAHSVLRLIGKHANYYEMLGFWAMLTTIATLALLALATLDVFPATADALRRAAELASSCHKPPP